MGRRSDKPKLIKKENVPIILVQVIYNHRNDNNQDGRRRGDFICSTGWFVLMFRE
jgi:hypothetical protein